jgi:hypothetical protein
MVRLALSAPPRSLFGARAAVTRATLPRCAVADDDDDDGDELVGGETLNLRGRSVSELFLVTSQLTIYARMLKLSAHLLLK